MSLFKVHTDSGKYTVSAKNPQDARKQIKDTYGENATKVKLLGGEKREKGNADAK